MSDQSNYPLRPLTIVRVGNDERPASPDDIEGIRKDIEKALSEEGDGILVAHHAVDAVTVYVPDADAKNLESYDDGYSDGYEDALDTLDLGEDEGCGDCECSECTGDYEKPAAELPARDRPPTWAETFVDFLTAVAEGVTEAFEEAFQQQENSQGEGDDEAERDADRNGDPEDTGYAGEVDGDGEAGEAEGGA